ncbi:matrixin family metalloprotease [Bdellovibrionota bacterium FG-2]
MKRVYGIVLAVGVLSFQNARAFTMNIGSMDLGWDTNTLQVDVDYNGCSISADELNAAIDKGFAVWNGVSTSRLTVLRGDSVSVIASDIASKVSPGNPVIICDPNFTATSGFDGNYVPAVTMVNSISDTTSRITFAYMLLNGQAKKAANLKNIPADLVAVVIAHEMGHILGLGHSADINALMYFDASDKSEVRLSMDDVDGVTYLYPRQELSNSKLFGCATVAAGSSGGPGGSGFSGFVSFLALIGFCALVTKGFARLPPRILREGT